MAVFEKDDQDRSLQGTFEGSIGSWPGGVQLGLHVRSGLACLVVYILHPEHVSTKLYQLGYHMEWKNKCAHLCPNRITCDIGRSFIGDSTTYDEFGSDVATDEGGLSGVKGRMINGDRLRIRRIVGANDFDFTSASL